MGFGFVRSTSQVLLFGRTEEYSSDFGCVPFIRQAKGTNESASDHSLFAIALVWPIHVIPSAGSANASESPLLGCDGVRTGLDVYRMVLLLCFLV